MDFSTIRKNLENHGFSVSVFDHSDEAVKYLEEEIQNTTVGFGGSMTLRELGLYQILSRKNSVYWHHEKTEGKTNAEIIALANSAEVYLSSVNGIAESGEIVNIDGNCNRISSVLWGHKKVYFVVGKNKVERDYESALYRARNIASPLNAKRIGVKTPCAIKADKCYDCKSPERICRGLSVLWEVPMTGSFEVVLINEDLGY